MRRSGCGLLILWLCSAATGLDAEPTFAERLSSVRSAADLEAVIAATKDAALIQAFREQKSVILQAAAEQEHAQAVARAVEMGQGKLEWRNTTPAALQKAIGGELPLFNALVGVDLAVAGMGPHDKRKVDPYDAAFFEHLGQLVSLESLHVISTKLNNETIAPLGRLKNVKTLRFTNNGKLTDDGLAHLAGLKNVEIFSFVGTGMQGHAFQSFDGWQRLTRCSFRGSSIDDEGLAHLCRQFPNLESISLAHAKFTDAGSVHLARLTKLKGLEIGSRNATTECLKHLSALPLEYLQLGDGLDASTGYAAVRAIPTLRRLTLTNCKMLTDEELKQVATFKQLEQLELGGLPLTDERLPLLRGFSFLKSLQLVNRPAGYPEEIQAKIAQFLPQVEVSYPH